MNLDAVSAVLRPRGPWEAVDLGFRLVRAWWRHVLPPWLAIMGVVWVLALPLLAWSPLLAVVLVWWGKPLYDRVPLYVVSRGLFGALPRWRETLTSRRVWRGGVLRSLTLQRFSWSRSFTMPVDVLEQPSGRARKQRLEVLLPGSRRTANWLTITCLGMELMLYLGLLGLVNLLLPEPWQIDWAAILFEASEGETSFWHRGLEHGLWLAAITLVEPFYVAAGFALYLNRRTFLEGWDVEVAFRRLGQRLTREMAAPGALRGTLVALAALALLTTLSTQASPITSVGEAWMELAAVESTSPEPADAGEAIREILARPEFGGEKTVRHWRPRWEAPRTPRTRETGSWTPPPIAAFLVLLLKGVLWLALFIVVVVLVLSLLRWKKPPEGSAAERAARIGAIPTRVAGLDIHPDTLPADIPREAIALLEAGDPVAALSLLYRGAVASLAHRRRVRVRKSWTEEDCLRHLSALLPPGGAEYLRRLTAAWHGAAYAHRPPPADELRELCHAWVGHFGSAAPVAGGELSGVPG